MASNPAVPDIALLTGPVFIGQLLNWCFFGALTVQAYFYYLAFPNDRLLPTKVLAFTVYFFEVVQTIMATRDGFRNFGFGWGNLAELDDVGTYYISGPIMSSIVSASGQIFYAWRLWVLSQQKFLLPCIIVALALVQCGAGLWAGGWAHQIGHFSEIQSITTKDTSVWLAGTALCDVIIAIAMTYTLLNRRTGMKSSDTIVIRVIRLSVETGAICAVFALCDLIFYVVFPHNNLHLAPSIALSKLYSNSLFAVLNSRMRIVGSRSMGDNSTYDPTLSAYPASSGQEALHMSSVSRRFNIPRPGVSVTVQSTTLHDNDASLDLSKAKFSDAYLPEPERAAV